MKNSFKDFNRLTDQPQFAIKFANVVFLLAVFYSILIAILAVYKTYKTYSVFNYSIFILFSVISATLFGLGLRLSNHLKINLSLLMFSVAITVYAFETYLELVPQKIKAKQSEVSLDSRTIMEVINDLNETGNEGYPNITPSLFTKSNGLGTNNGRIYPLGGISNVTTVNCKESGYWSIFESDEHGFNNPKGLYQRNKMEILLTGDSMAEGACVNSDESITAVIRNLGINAINIGKGGNGPLIEFAALKEYAEPLKPKIVLWQYYENDFNEVQKELGSPLLKKYLEEDKFSQNLIARQDEIKSLLKNYFLEILEQNNNKEILSKKMMSNKLINIMKLVNLRSSINLTPRPNPEVFKNILLKAKKLVSGWGGNLYFVYIPSDPGITNHPLRKVVLSTVTELGIPIIDIQREALDPHPDPYPDPLSLYPFRSTLKHYNSEGYRFMAEVIVKRLTADGLIKLN